MQPSDTYQSDMNIDLKKHHKPENFSDSFAYWTVKSLRIPTDLFFRVRISPAAQQLLLIVRLHLNVIFAFNLSSVLLLQSV